MTNGDGASYSDKVSHGSNDHSKIEAGDAGVTPHLGPGPPSIMTDDEATLFASPLPITGERKTTTRKELWVGMWQ